MIGTADTEKTCCSKSTAIIIISEMDDWMLIRGKQD